MSFYVLLFICRCSTSVFGMGFALTQHEEANHITWVEKLVSLLGVERIDFKPYCYSQLTKICARCKIIVSMVENPLQYWPLHLKRANTL